MNKYNDFGRTFNNPNLNLIFNDLLENNKSIFDMDFAKAGKAMNVLMGNMKTDIKESDTAFVVESEIPGFNKEDISAKVEDGVLTISAEMKDASKDANTNEVYIRRERFVGKYSRSFTFDGVDEDNIKASYTNGILVVTLPKLLKTSAKKTIEIV